MWAGCGKAAGLSPARLLSRPSCCGNCRKKLGFLITSLRFPSVLAGFSKCSAQCSEAFAVLSYSLSSPSLPASLCESLLSSVLYKQDGDAVNITCLSLWLVSWRGPCPGTEGETWCTRCGGCWEKCRLQCS